MKLINVKLLILASVFSCNLFGQQILNGNLENWDTNNYPTIPVNWLTNANFMSLPCSPLLLTAEQTNESNSGNWAVKLEEISCIEDGAGEQIYMGFLAYGNNINYPNIAYGLPFDQRPKQLNFYYKFKSIDTDTGFAKVVLRLLDMNGNAGQIIGEGKVSIINNTNVYTYMTVLINYFLPDSPEIIQIVFATSKTLADQENGPLKTTRSYGADIGTTLWIDDISVSGGSLGVAASQEKNSYCSIFPNPIRDFAAISFKNQKNENYTLKIFNGQGQLVKTICNIISNQVILDRKNLANGLYYFQLLSSNQSIYSGRFIIE